MTWMFLHCRSSRSKLISILFLSGFCEASKDTSDPLIGFRCFFPCLEKSKRSLTQSSGQKRTSIKVWKADLTSLKNTFGSYFQSTLAPCMNVSMLYDLLYDLFWFEKLICLMQICLFIFQWKRYLRMYCMYVCANYVCKHTFHFWNKSAHISLICF